MPAVGARFAVAHFNLPVINPPCPRGIFVEFLAEDVKKVPSTSLD